MKRRDYLGAVRRIWRQVRGEREKTADGASATLRDHDMLDAIMENTPAHLAYLDPEFRFVRVNQTYADGSGHSRAELIGRYHFDLFPNEENQRVFEQVRDTRQPVTFRAKPFEYADQPWRGVTYWDWTLAPDLDSSGNLDGLVFSLHDVTEETLARQDLEKAYREVRALNRELAAKKRLAERQEARFRILLQTLAEGIAILDTRKRVTFVNDVGTEILGIAPLSRPTHLHDLGVELTSLDGVRIRTSGPLLAAMLRGEGPVSREFLVHRPDGSIRQVAINYGRITRPRQVQSIVCSFRDVTEVRKLERAKDDYLQVLAHELRNPLASAYGLVQLARRRDGMAGSNGGPDTAALLELAEGELERLKDLVDDILTGYRVANGRLPLEFAEIDLRDVIRQAAAPHLLGSPSHHLHLGDPPAGRIAVRGDSRRLVEVLTNLLTNAVKYSPAGSDIWLDVETGPEKVAVSVADEGIGIPPDQRERVFQGFYRGSNLSDRQPGGIGLGLYISRDIARRHGGDLWADVREGGGTVMRLSLPLAGGV